MNLGFLCSSLTATTEKEQTLVVPGRLVYDEIIRWQKVSLPECLNFNEPQDSFQNIFELRNVRKPVQIAVLKRDSF